MHLFEQTSCLPRSLRARYLQSLPEPQEWFLEELVQSGEAWACPNGGYAVFSGDTLVEFYVTDGADACAQLLNLVQRRPFKEALCKSFDGVLLKAAKKLGWRQVETGYLFRKRAKVILADMPGFQLVRATTADLSEAWDIGGDFYDSREEVEGIYRKDGLWIATIDGKMAGNGTAIPVDQEGQVIDVGMVTQVSQRNKGIGARIVATVADLLEYRGIRPICGCAETNIASKIALEKAGFVSEHRLVQITVTD